MLLEFSVENYLSFKDRVTLTTYASIRKNSENNGVYYENGKINIRKSISILGANASGKSNLLKAISFMKSFTFNSSRLSEDGLIQDVDNFKLSSDCDGKASFFEIVFVTDSNFIYPEKKRTIFRYGFTVSKQGVESEWLFGIFKKSEALLIFRQNDELKIGDYFKEGKKLKSLLGKINIKTLFLNQIFNIKGENAPITFSIFSWFRKVNNLTNLSNFNLMGITGNLLKDERYKKKILDFLKIADVGIEEIFKVEEDITFPGNIISKNRVRFKTLHTKYGLGGEPVSKKEFDFSRNESQGTKRLFAILGPVIHAIEENYIILIDEIDAMLHPHLITLIIGLFNSSNEERKSQIIFTSHNTLFLKFNDFARDQIYIVDKNKYGVSDLYSLSDIENLRNDASFEKDYLLGKYGGVPYLGNIEEVFTDYKTNQDK